MSEELLKIDFERDEPFEQFKDFIKDSNLEISGDIKLTLSEKQTRGWWRRNFVSTPCISEFFHYEDHLSFDTDEKNYERVKKLLSEFTKKHKIKVNLTVKRQLHDC